MSRNINFLYGLAFVGSFFAASAACADEGATSVAANPADYDEGPDFYLRGEVGVGFGTEADVGGGNLQIDDGTFLQAGAGLDFGKLALDVTASRSSADINFGVAQVDAHLTSYMVNGEFDFTGPDDYGLYGRAGYGISNAEVELAFGSFDADGQTWAAGGGYRFELGGVDADIGYEYRSTSGLDFGFGSDVEVDGHTVRFGVKV